MKKRKLITFILLIGSVLTLNYIFGWSKYFQTERIVELFSDLIQENLFVALLAYTVFTIVGCVVLALPGITFAVVAGLLFGPVLGTIACSLGTTIGAIIAFLTGRFFLKDSIKPKIEKNKYIKKWLFDESGKNELFVLMITRLVPLFPYNLQNFAYGVTDIKFSTYAIGSLLFMLPGTAMYTVGTAGLADDENRILYIGIAVIIGVIVMGMGTFLKKRYVQQEQVLEAAELPTETFSKEGERMNTVAEEGCVHCHLCRNNCVFLEKHKLDVVDLAKHPELLYHCYLCGKCTEVCPKGIDGRQSILNLRRQQVANAQEKVMEKGYGMLLLEKKNYLFKNYKNGKGKSVLFPGCNFPSFYPETTERLVKLLAEHDIGVVYDCCGKPIGELGLEKREQEIHGEIKKRLKESGVEELITLCPNCYYSLKDKLDIPVVTIYEKLSDLGYKEKMSRTILSGATFLPCPDRKKQKFLQDMEPFLEGTPEIISDVQCCGLGGCAAGKEPELSKNMSETIGNHRKEVYVYCASCASNFARNGVTGVKHYLSEILEVHEMPDTKKSLLNRAKKRF